MFLKTNSAPLTLLAVRQQSWTARMWMPRVDMYMAMAVAAAKADCPCSPLPNALFKLSAYRSLT